jgi:hypothetical protein
LKPANTLKNAEFCGRICKFYSRNHKTLMQNLSRTIAEFATKNAEFHRVY